MLLMVLFLEIECHLRVRMYAYFKWRMRHPVLKWWIQKIYDGAWMQKDVLVVGSPKHIWQWDGGDCHPWF